MKPKTVLFVGRGTQLASGCGHQAISLLENQRALKARGFTLTFKVATTSDEVVRQATAEPHDFVFLLFPWRDNAEVVSAALKQIRKGQTGKIALLDYTDQTCSPHWGALPFVDYFIKPFLLRPLDRYQEDFAGGYIFTDFLSKQLGHDLKEWTFHSPLDPNYVDKIKLGWNLAAIGRYHRMAKLGRFSLPFRLRPFDVNLRFSVGNYDGRGQWYTDHRRSARELVRSLTGRRISGERRLTFKRYLVDLSFSKVVVSPFGWGEVCFRDYEAVVCRSLLIKPSMDHMVTEPNIFIPNETYVPVRWDLADLTEKCEYYLNRPAESQRIIKNAAKAFESFFKSGQMVERFTEIVGGPPILD